MLNANRNQACENCRLKKTKCDESRPKCGLCKSLGLDCIYNERKTSKYALTHQFTEDLLTRQDGINPSA